jgi:ABC-type multidrug transport system fused ATPase/permease subunit
MRSEIVLILVYLLGRFLFYNMNAIVNPRQSGESKIIKRSFIGLIAVMLAGNIYSVILIILLHELLIIFDSLLKPKNPKTSRFWYLLHILTALLITPLIIHLVQIILPWLNNPVQYIFFEFIRSTVILNLFFDKLKLDQVLLVLSGYIFTLKEGTILIRLTLNRMRAIPKKKDKPTQRDREEYDRGMLIGLLERTFLYFLIIFNQIGAIAVIIALKSLARFKELDDKNFAEYFLIGSLLSVLMAAIPAIVVLLMMR